MKEQSGLQKQVSDLQAQLEEQKKKNASLERQLSLARLNTEKKEADSRKNSTSAAKLTRSKLWSSISHELLTPMDAILGMTELVMETELNEEQSDYLEMIHASADRLFGVVGDVIDYSELVEGKLRCDMVNFNLTEVLEYDLYVAKLTAKHKDLDFSVDFAKTIPKYLHSDPSRLRQVLGTLIHNGIAFTSEGKVSLRVDTGGYDESGRLLLRFTVQDNGCGLSDNVRQTLFDFPMTLDISGGADKFSEGGLSLVVAAKLVEYFGGEIGVSSGQDRGATFWFTWPVGNPVEMYMGDLPQDMFDDMPDYSMVLRSARVLLAEDEYINASVTKAFLEQVGVAVDVVNTGREAVGAIRDSDYDAVLMDVQMPDLDGIEATVEIRRSERGKGRRCPIIALTAHGRHGDRERCLQAGMDDYLAKPLDKDQLIDMLTRYVTKKAMVVGSDPGSQHDILLPLIQKGWAVVIAETKRSAMYEASLSHFDLIVIDASLPAEEGIEIVKTIRRLEQFSGCRATIIGVGFSSTEDQEELQGSGIDEFYGEPQGVEQFADRVERFSALQS